MRESERGNVLFYILIAVALLGSLSYAVSQSSRGNVSEISEEKTRLLATEIIEYGNILANGTGQLKLRGHRNTEISLENNGVNGYANANCIDDTCKVFHVSGAGIIYRSPETEWLDSSQSAQPQYGNLYFASSTCIIDVGTNSTTLCNDSGDDEELLMIMPWLKKEICVEINDLLGINNPGGDPPQDTGASWSGGFTKFTGSYGGSEEIGEGGGSDLAGKTAGCFEGGGTPPAGSYHFYRVLIAR